MRILIISFVFLFVLAGIATAVGIGASPGRVEFDTVLRDGYAERTIRISSITDDTIAGDIRVDDEFKQWISFFPNSSSFQAGPDDPYELTVIVQPPTDTPTGNYSTEIEVISNSISDVSGRAGGVVKTAIILKVDIEVSGDEFIDCRAGGFRLQNIEQGFPLDFSFNLINDGNVRLSPTVAVDVWDQLQESLVFSTTLNGKQVLPTTQEDLLLRMNPALDQGQYWANVRVEECNVEDLLTFSVVEPGGIVDIGELRNIIVDPTIELGQTAEVLANFVNKGPRAVNARFQGVARKEGVLITQLESDEFVVPPGEEVNMPMFFTPFDPGRYELSGRVVYNKKLSFERSSILTVYSPDEITENTWLTLLLFFIILFTILFLLRKIVKERRRKQHHRF